MKLSRQQHSALRLLSEYPVTTRELMWKLTNVHGPGWTWDSVHAVLRRLENRELVRRIDFEPVTVWQVTEAGRKAVGR